MRARDFITRSISRRPSARLIDSRLSRCSLPRASPISTFARLTGRPDVALPGPLLRPVNRLQRLLGLSDCDLSTLPRWLLYPCVLDTAKAETVLGLRATHHIKFGE